VSLAEPVRTTPRITCGWSESADMRGYRDTRRARSWRIQNADGDTQAPVVVSLSAASSSWMTKPAPSSATSRAQVRFSPAPTVPLRRYLTQSQSARTTSSACSSPNVRLDVCDKRTPPGAIDERHFIRLRSSLRKLWASIRTS
jgi:hypothetical protein